MEVVVYIQHQNPQTVEVILPNWSTGGPREKFTLSLWEALQLRAALTRALP